MAVSFRHATQASGPNNPHKQVSVSAWNEEHVLTGTAGNLLGFDANGLAIECGTFITPQQYGAVGGGVTDDGPAFAAAIAALKAFALNVNGFYQSSPKLFVPAGNYYLGTTTLDITHTLVIEGEGDGLGGNSYASKLRWAAGTTGIRVQNYLTSGAATRDGAGHTAGGGTCLRGLHIYGGYAGVEGEYHGIHAKDRIAVEHCRIENFAGDGIYCDVSAASGGSDVGNANSSRVFGSAISACRNGVYIHGADANIWAIVGVDASGNRRWGFNDQSFLGNSYFACTSESNGLVPGTIPTVVTQSGNRYCVKKDQGVGASTNAPSGTTADNAWWYYMGAGGALSGANIAAWSNGTTYRDGGSYRGGDGSGNSNNYYGGCYHEAGQGFAQIDAPALVSGGSMRPNVRGVPTLYGATSYLGSTLGFLAEGDLTSRGTNFSFGPISGAGLDAVGGFNFTNTLQISFTRWNADGSFAATDGYLWSITGATYLNGTNGVVLRHNGTAVATTVAGGLDLPSGKVLSIAGTQVIGPRQTGWAADTGTAKKTATAAYVVGSALSASAAYVQAEATAVITRQGLVEAALRDATQEIKAIKDALIAHGIIGT
jgi:hypothetical protein